MTPQAFLGRIVSCLADLGTDHVLTGSVAVALYGRPRLLKDFDIVIRGAIPTTAELTTALPVSHFSVLRDQCTIVTPQDRTTIIERRLGWKAELFFPPVASAPDPQVAHCLFERPFARRQRLRLAGGQAWVCSAEDILLVKLLLCARGEGPRQKHWDDAVYIYLVQADRLDRGYVEDWVARLNLHPVWDRLRDAARLP